MSPARSAAFVLLLVLGSMPHAGLAQQGAGVAAPPRELPPRSSPGYEQPAAGSPYGIPAAPGAPAPMVIADPDTELGVGDQVSFSITEDREPPITLRVTDSGELEVPYIGRLAARGRTCAQLASDIKQRLEADYYYRATVRLGIDQVNRVASVGRVFVTGYIRAPGPQPIMPGEKLTVCGVIVKAGGFTQFSDSRKVKLTRRNRGTPQNFVLDAKAILEEGRLELDMEVKDGDYIYVPQKLINF
jgi:protein involved in polysaccharide export with SLBB domain